MFLSCNNTRQLLLDSNTSLTDVVDANISSPNIHLCNIDAAVLCCFCDILGISKAHLSILVDVARSTTTRWLTGKTTPSISFLGLIASICRHYNINLFNINNPLYNYYKSNEAIRLLMNSYFIKPIYCDISNSYEIDNVIDIDRIRLTSSASHSDFQYIYKSISPTSYKYCCSSKYNCKWIGIENNTGFHNFNITFQYGRITIEIKGASTFSDFSKNLYQSVIPDKLKNNFEVSSMDVSIDYNYPIRMIVPHCTLGYKYKIWKDISSFYYGSHKTPLYLVIYDKEKDVKEKNLRNYYEKQSKWKYWSRVEARMKISKRSQSVTNMNGNSERYPFDIMKGMKNPFNKLHLSTASEIDLDSKFAILHVLSQYVGTRTVIQTIKKLGFNELLFQYENDLLEMEQRSNSNGFPSPSTIFEKNREMLQGKINWLLGPEESSRRVAQ